MFFFIFLQSWKKFNTFTWISAVGGSAASERWTPPGCSGSPPPSEKQRWRPLVTWLRPVRVDDFWEKRALKNCSRTPILKFPFEMFRFNLAQGLRKFWMLPYEKWANKLFCFGMSSLIFKNLKMKRNSYPTKQNIRIRNPAFFVYDIFLDSRLFRCLNRAWRSHSRQSRFSW